jgi:hypothetical protein
MASRRKENKAAKKSLKRPSRAKVSLSVSTNLKRRITSAATAQDLSITDYLTRLLDGEYPVRTGRVSAEMIRRSDELRARQKAPFPEDSVDLIREAREERDRAL